MIPIHPRIVHFPVALLITATVFGILSLVFRNKRKKFMELLIWNLAFGVGGAFLAIISGLREEKTLVHSDKIHEIMETHELLGFIFSGVLFIVLIWMILRRSKMRLPEFTSIVILLVLSSGLIVFGAHLGGRLVYEEGAGVLPMENVNSGEDHNHQHENGKTEGHETIIGNDSLEQSKIKESQDSQLHDHSSHQH